MRILILGGTGFIGKAIFYTLISKKEHEIFIGSRSQIEGYKNWKKKLILPPPTILKKYCKI
jgi:NAD dependent epimerase/dehydratase family enzyme